MRIWYYVPSVTTSYLFIPVKNHVAPIKTTIYNLFPFLLLFSCFPSMIAITTLRITHCLQHPFVLVIRVSIVMT